MRKVAIIRFYIRCMLSVMREQIPTNEYGVQSMYGVVQSVQSALAIFSAVV